MRHLAAAAAALGLSALALTAIGPTQAAEDATPGLLTSEELKAPAPGDAPVILRGSASGPRTGPAAEASAARWQVSAGKRLWLFDPETEDVRTCAVRDTTEIGVKEIRCRSGTAGRFRRTFGPTFQP